MKNVNQTTVTGFGKSKSNMFVPNTVPLLETVDEGGEGWTLGMQHNVVP